MSMTKDEQEYVDRIEADENNGLAKPISLEEFETDIMYERVTVRLSREDTQKIDEICRQKSIGRSTVLRIALRDWLADREAAYGSHTSHTREDVDAEFTDQELTVDLKLGSNSFKVAIESLIQAGVIEDVIIRAPLRRRLTVKSAKKGGLDDIFKALAQEGWSIAEEGGTYTQGRDD